MADHGHQEYVKLLEVSPAGTRVVSAGSECWVGVWSGNSGLMLRQHYLSNRAVSDVRFAPNGSWFAAFSYHGRAMIAWDTQTLQEIKVPLAELNQLLFNSPCPKDRYEFTKNEIEASFLNDTGVTLVDVSDLQHWCSDAEGRIWTASIGPYVSIFRLEGEP